MSGLARHWQRVTAVSLLLYPFSLVFRCVVALRRAAYSSGLLKSLRISVPVVVIGNITVGGTGKTPLALWLAALLTRHGMRPGIVSRGYGAAVAGPAPVLPSSNPFEIGDEPVLLAQRSACPVWVGRDRVAAARALLAAHRDCDVILSDDGLQHYRLARDVDIAVIDGDRGLGNGFMLPAGPLRERAARLREVDAVVIHGGSRRADARKRAYAMRLEGREFHNLLDPEHVAEPAHFQGKRVHAVAGIGNPERFFAHLVALGIEFEAHPFSDHHSFRAADLAFQDADAVLMTEKDAVKCAPFASEIYWALRVDAKLDAALGELVLSTLKKVEQR